MRQRVKMCVHVLLVAVVHQRVKLCMHFYKPVTA